MIIRNSQSNLKILSSTVKSIVRDVGIKPDAPVDKSNKSSINLYPSYASIVVVDVVKEIVSRTMVEQWKADTNSLSVIVHGFPEESNDNHELLTMFDYLHCRCEITHHFRMGRIIV